LRRFSKQQAGPSRPCAPANCARHGPFDEAGFEAFNKEYVGTLARWGLFDGQTNPVARSNVCPAIDAPEVPGFYAFSYTVADASAAPSFVVAGSGEAPEGKGNYKDHIVNLGDISSEGLLNKARFVLGEMETGCVFWASVGQTLPLLNFTRCTTSSL
jgi:hypothetical protein